MACSLRLDAAAASPAGASPEVVASAQEELLGLSREAQQLLAADELRRVLARTAQYAAALARRLPPETAGAILDELELMEVPR